MSVYLIGLSERPVALVSQPYGIPDGGDDVIRAWCADHGVEVEFPDWPSWQYPGSTRLCVYSRPSSKVLEDGLLATIQALRPGDSFLLPESRKAALMRRLAKEKKYYGRTFTTREVGEGSFRIWRTK